MKYLFVLLLVIGCVEKRTSEILEEEGVVVSELFIPKHIVTYPTIEIDADGDVSVGIDTDVIPDYWEIVFQCQHGQFKVKNNKALCDDLNQGDRVTILYKQIFNVKKDKEGKEALTHYDYDFIGAIKDKKIER